MNTIHSVSNTSRMRSSEAVAVRNSFSFRSLMMRVMLVMAIVVGGKVAWGETVTYTITSTSAVSTSGTAPAGSSATFSTTYTNKNQLTAGNSMTLTLSGYAGYKITGITLSMKSNKKAGAGNMSAVVGLTTLASIANANFNNPSWHGSYSESYVDVTPTMSNSNYVIQSGQNVVITIAATANSLYCQSFTITYELVSVFSYTVSFDAGTGDCSTLPLTGTSITLPTASAPVDCSSYSFYGWTEEAVGESSIPPSIVGVAGDTYNPSSDITLHAVYSKDISYQKVTSNLFDWSGAYLIICESESVAFDGSLETLDVANNNIPVTISSNTIESTPTTNASAFVIARNVDDYTIKSVYGYYIGRTTSSNGLESSVNPEYFNTISYSGGSISIKSASVDYYLKFNSTSGQKRFRYFASDQQDIQLYKQTGVFNSNPDCSVATLTYHPNGAISGSVPTGVHEYSRGDEVIVLGNTGNLEMADYTFAGWNTASDGSGITYTAGQTFTINENTILYAKWTINQYEIIWMVNGNLQKSISLNYGSTIGAENAPLNEDIIPAMCDNSKTFVGWSESGFEETNTPPAIITSAEFCDIAVTGNKTYYAVFAINEGLSNNYKLYNGILTEGDYIIYYSRYAMKNNISGNRLGYQTVTPSDGVISNPSLSIVWHIAQNGSYWTLYNDDVSRYAASTGANNKAQLLEDGTDDKSLWSVSGCSTYEFVNKYNSDHGFNAYLRNNGTSGFSCYSTSTGGALSLYKRSYTYSAYTTFCPCAFDTDGIDGDNNYIWSGKNVGDDWGLTSNWVSYNSSETKYHLAANEPTNSTKVFIINSTDCNIVTPTVAEDANCGNLTINGLNIDIAENQTLTINGTATFTNGIINGNVVFGEDATVSGTSTSSHVNGVVTKSGTANGFTFPTGSNGNLGKVVVTDGTATNVSVQYFSNPAGFGANDLPRWWNAADMSGENPFNHVSNVEYWRISSTEAITANFIAEASTDMHFNSETAEEDRIPANIQMAFYDNNRWTNVGGSASIEGNTLKITGAEIPTSATRGISGNYTTFGSKSKSTVLPIELVSFTANCNGRSALIEWTTATEKNNDFFVLERSNDAVNFKEIARIAGAGNSIEPISYAYTDYGVRNGDNYYRLVQVDYDGTSTTSEIIVANCLGTDGEPEVLAYPNPFGDDLTLRFENFGNIQATVEVYDMLGRMVHTQKVNCSQNDYEVVLRLAGLSDGTYNVRISTADFVINRKVVKE